MCMKRTKGSFDILGRKTDVSMQLEEGATDSTKTDFHMQFREGAVSFRKTVFHMQFREGAMDCVQLLLSPRG